MLAAIVAMARNRVIGGNNQLLWRLPEDLRYFKEKTNGHVIIMGRKTFASLPGLLPNREHWVITRQRDFAAAHPEVRVFHSVEEACEAAKALPLHEDGIAAFIIGGAEIYAASLPYVDRIYRTEIDADVEGDAYFPGGITDAFACTSRSDAMTTERYPWTYTFATYDRVTQG